MGQVGSFFFFILNKLVKFTGILINKHWWQSINLSHFMETIKKRDHKKVKIIKDVTVIIIVWALCNEFVSCTNCLLFFY